MCPIETHPENPGDKVNYFDTKGNLLLTTSETYRIPIHAIIYVKIENDRTADSLGIRVLSLSRGGYVDGNHLSSDKRERRNGILFEATDEKESIMLSHASAPSKVKQSV